MLTHCEVPGCHDVSVTKWGPCSKHLSLTSSDQQMPTVGPKSRSVTAELRILLDARERKGIETYGRSLETHNGRSAPRDLVEELIDGAQYALQWELERADLLRERLERIEEIGRLKLALEAQRRVMERIQADANNELARHRAVEEFCADREARRASRDAGGE